MQTFLPYADFAESAQCLDNKRLGKQRVECLQILNALARGPTIFKCTGCNKLITNAGDCECYAGIGVRLIKTPWYNHPAVKMWKGWECTLFEYSCIICNEWTKRGFKDTCKDKISALHYDGDALKNTHIVTDRQQGYNEYYTPWLGNKVFHASHRSNLLRKNPEHYKQFGWKEPDNLPYVWPV